MELATQRSAALEKALGPGAPIVVFDKVSLAFDDHVVLEKISFTMITGHMKIILGASGSGKSTILKLILGLLRPDEGVIWVNGDRIDQTMQAGPGAENAYSGIATAYSDSVPILVLASGYPRDTAQVFHFFRSSSAYSSVSKWTEEINVADQALDVMRRAFSLLKMGRPGPVIIEIPRDVQTKEFGENTIDYRPVKSTRAAANTRGQERFS